jgi:hypothetical protein
MRTRVSDAPDLHRRPCQHFRFALKPRQPIGVSRYRRGQHLDRHLPLQVRVDRPIDLTMPPTPSWAVTSYGPRRVPGVKAIGV